MVISFALGPRPANKRAFSRLPVVTSGYYWLRMVTSGYYGLLPLLLVTTGY